MKAARVAHGIGRLIFGLWFFGAGIEFFLPGLQPLAEDGGTTDAGPAPEINEE